MNKILIPAFILLFNYSASTQNIPQNKLSSGKSAITAIDKVLQKTESNVLLNMAREYSLKNSKKFDLITKLRMEKGWNIKSSDTAFNVFELNGFTENGFPLFYATSNNGTNGGAITSSTNALWPHGSLCLGLTGENMKIAEWDGGAVRSTHVELAGRVTQKDGYTTLSGHSTHVAGTLISTGIDTVSRGMSFQANLDAYQWDNDYAEMCVAAAKGLLISNHSYTYLSGWEWGTWSGGASKWHFFGRDNEFTGWMFGAYASARDWDLIAYNAPYYTIVKAAGNEHNQDPWSLNSSVDTTLHFMHLDSMENWLDGGPIGSINNPARARQTGYDLLDPLSTAKNIITVANVVGIAGGYTSPSQVILNSSSSWGKTDDGRIKPDISAKGTVVYSLTATSNTSYASASGTSMASPMVAGALLLLQQHFHNQFGEYMRSSTLRGLVIHTADEAGTYEGPDYKFGWGLLNTKKAAVLISVKDSLSLIQENDLRNGTTWKEFVYSNGATPLTATICWTDPQGSATELMKENSTVSRLVNDLDIRITRNGSTWYPYLLNPNNPTAAATKGDNFRDNVEKIFISAPDSGFYTITVNHKGNLANTQTYSLMVSGISAKEPVISSFYPPSGKVGTEVIINGENFTGITEVIFDTTKALTLFIDSTNRLRAFVPPGASSGKISIVNCKSTAMSATDFTVTGNAETPFIHSFAPLSAGIDKEVMIYGHYFADATSVKFNTGEAKSFTVLSDSVIAAVISPASSSGRISVTTNGGTGFSDSLINIRLFYCYITSDTTGSLVIGPAVFSPDNPGLIHSLAPTTSVKMMSAATWMKGRWICAEFLKSGSGGHLYEINPTTGTMTLLGNLGRNFNGLAYDETSSTLFGITDTLLYTINILNASSTLIGNTGISNSTFINLACNRNGQLFAANITNNNLYYINKTNGAATLIGPMGIDISYSQDMEFDRSNDSLYLAGFIYRPGKTYQGNLYKVNTLTGEAMLAGMFQNQAQITGLAIPYYPPGTTFSGSGNWSDNERWSNGKPGSKSDAVIEGDATITSDASCFNLTIKNNGSLSLPENSSLTVNGTMTLKSDSSGTGSFIYQGLYHSPNQVDIERFISPNSWHLVSSPLTSARSAVFNGAWLMDYNEQTNNWNNSITSPHVLLTPGKGFAIYDTNARGKVFLFSGLLNAGNISPAIHFSDTGYNLVGNPYPSALTGTINTWDKASINNAIWVWKESDGNYKTWNGVTGTLTGGIIPSMQGFFVKAYDNNPFIVLPPSSQTADMQGFYKSTRTNELTMKVEKDNLSDELLISFDENATDEFDTFFDVEKFYGSPSAPQIYSLSEDKKLSINGLFPGIGAKTVQVAFEPRSSGHFTLHADGLNSFSHSATILLNDLKAGHTVNLVNEQNYTFNGSITDSPGRFLLIFDHVAGVDNKPGKENVIIYSFGNDIYISSDSPLNKIEIFNITGQLVYESRMYDTPVIKACLNNAKGCYIVRASGKEKCYTARVFIW